MLPSLLWAFLRRRYVLESSYDLQSRSGPWHDRRGSWGAGCECYVGLDVVSGGLRREGWSKTNHDESRSLFSRRTGGASHFLGPPLVFLLPKILRRARTDSSCPRVLPPPSSAGMAWIVLDLRVHVVSGGLTLRCSTLRRVDWPYARLIVRRHTCHLSSWNPYRCRGTRIDNVEPHGYRRPLRRPWRYRWAMAYSSWRWWSGW